MIDVEKLDPDRWLDCAARVRQKVEEPELYDLEAVIRRGFHLAQLAPLTGSLLSGHLPDEAKFDTLLENGATESAVLSLVGEKPSLQVSRLADKHYEAFVSLNSADIDGTGRASHFASAVLSAWLDFALKLTASIKAEADLPQSAADEGNVEIRIDPYPVRM